MIEFLFKYIWLFCFILIILELGSTVYSANILMKKSAQGVLQSVSGEISSRVDNIIRLLEGFSNDERFSDISVSLYDRAIQAEPYRKSYDLFMIALTDENVNVVSSDTKQPPTKLTSLSYRDYMKKLYSTGTYQITDAFLSGADGLTMNYTIAVPIIKNGIVKGSIFGSIYFDDIEAILNRDIHNTDSSFFLLGENNTVMIGETKDSYGKTFAAAVKDYKFFGTTISEINNNIKEKPVGSYWEFKKNELCYTMYEKVLPTNWTLLYQVRFSSVILTLMPALIIKSCFYFILCFSIAIFVRRYLNKQFSAVNHLLNKVTTIQKEIFQSEQSSYDDLLELTQKGLTDELTGLFTRAVLFNKITHILEFKSPYGAFMFIDLDDLKQINDNYGHEAGDYSLIHFAKILKQIESEFDCIPARYGGDEFILIVQNITEKEASNIARKLCSLLGTTISIGKNSFIPIHGSIGVSLYPDHGMKPEELICKADLALYSAKQTGKNRYVIYDEAKETSEFHKN